MGRGRPREFDLDAALDRALLVFWTKGYEGATLPDLTEAMGINRPSLYAAFGNKESLFRKALDRYVKATSHYMAAALAEPNARDAVERLLRESADRLVGKSTPRGCLVVQSALVCGEESESVKRELIDIRIAAESKLCERLKRAAPEGALPPGINAADLAKYVVTVLHGMSIQAANGARHSQLHRVVDIAMQVWPK